MTSPVLWLPPDVVDALVAHAQAEAPDEACGLIVGRGGRAARAIPVANVAADSQHQYVMDPAALAAHLPRVDREGLDLIALYHSHPRGAPLPSPTDIAQATFPHTPYVIIGRAGDEMTLAAWDLTYGRAVPIDVHLGLHPPDARDADRPLGASGWAAVVIAVVVGFIIVVALSLTLLPPSPQLP